MAKLMNELNEIFATARKLPPVERAEAMLEVITWCQQTLAPAGAERRLAFLAAREELGMSELEIAGANNTTPAVVKRMITEALELRRMQSD